MLNARSLHALPKTGEIRERVQAYLDHLGGPVAFLWKKADAIEAGAPPVLIERVREEAMQDPDLYQAGLYKTTYRCSEAHFNAVSEMARLCGIPRTTFIRAALHWWDENKQPPTQGT